MIWLYVTFCFVLLAGMLLLGIALLARRCAQLEEQLEQLDKRVDLLAIERELDDETVVMLDLSERLMDAYRRRPIRES